MSICRNILKRKPGRPPALSETDRRHRILAAAERCFVTNGYRTTQMDDVVRACGMSKKTVYQAFGTKEKLFAALIDSVIEEAVDLGHLREDVAPEAALADILTRLAGFILSDRQVALLRLVISESAHAPELAVAFHENGIRRCKDRLMEILARMQAAGHLRLDDPAELASHLVGATIGETLVTALIRRPRPETDTQRAARIARLLALVRPALSPDAETGA